VLGAESAPPKNTGDTEAEKVGLLGFCLWPPSPSVRDLFFLFPAVEVLFSSTWYACPTHGIDTE
jgi:hypothetical protein